MADSSDSEVRPSTSTTSQRPHLRCSPLEHAQTVQFVKMMDAMDYDGTDRGPSEHRNVYKSLVLGKVRGMLVRRFDVIRTNKQLQKRWSDLKLKEPRRLASIRKEIAEQAEKPTPKGGRSSRTSASPPTPHSPEASAVADEETPSSEEDSHEVEFSNPGVESDHEDVAGKDLSMSSSNSSHPPPQLLKTEEEEEDDVVVVEPATTAVSPLTAEIRALKAMGVELEKQSKELTTEYYKLARHFLTLGGKMCTHMHDRRAFNDRLELLHLFRGADGGK